jgi:hypothetical protein
MANKEPMIGRENRPTAIDWDMSVSDLKLRDLMSVVNAQITPEILKTEHFKVEKEVLKGEKEKEFFKPEKEKEILKGEKEKEHFKPEKEALKPEKEALKPELSKPFDPTTIEQIVSAVIDRLKTQGVVK